MRLGGFVALFAVTLLVTAAGVTAATGGARAPESAPLPCSAAFERLAGGTRLDLSVTCTAGNVLIVRVEFPHGVKLRAQRPFAGAACEDSTSSTWNCVFPADIPPNVQISGSVRFAKAIPRAPQHAHVFFYESQTAPDLAIAASLTVSPIPFTGTFTY